MQTAEKLRFTVFGVDISTGLLVEQYADTIHEAVLYHDNLSCFDYKARIWDNVQHGFVKQESIEKFKN